MHPTPLFLPSSPVMEGSSNSKSASVWRIAKHCFTSARRPDISARTWVAAAARVAEAAEDIAEVGGRCNCGMGGLLMIVQTMQQVPMLMLTRKNAQAGESKRLSLTPPTFPEVL